MPWVTEESSEKTVAFAFTSAALASDGADYYSGPNNINGLRSQITRWALYPDQYAGAIRNDFDLSAKALAGGSDAVDADRAAAQAKLIEQFGRGAAAAHARFVRATFVELPELSVDVTVAAANPAAFVARSGAELAKILSDEQGFNSRLIRVVDEAGTPVLYASFVHRLNSGSLWIAPQYEGRSDVYGTQLLKP